MNFRQVESFKGMAVFQKYTQLCIYFKNRYIDLKHLKFIITNDRFRNGYFKKNFEFCCFMRDDKILKYINTDNTVLWHFNKGQE